MSPRQGDAVGNDQPEKRRRASRRRAVIPSPEEAVKEAKRIAAKRQKLTQQLEDIRTEQLKIVAQLRATGASHTEIAELLGVTNGRAYQLAKEAEEAGLL